MDSLMSNKTCGPTKTCKIIHHSQPSKPKIWFPCSLSLSIAVLEFQRSSWIAHIYALLMFGAQNKLTYVKCRVGLQNWPVRTSDPFSEVEPFSSQAKHVWPRKPWGHPLGPTKTELLGFTDHHTVTPADSPETFLFKRCDGGRTETG